MTVGSWGRILRVDLTSRSVTTEPFSAADQRAYIGGAGLAARLLYDETDANTDPLGPANPLIFAVGPLTGTRVPMTGRHHVAARSPLTGLWGESDCGGAWGWELKAAGMRRRGGHRAGSRAGLPVDRRRAGGDPRRRPPLGAGLLRDRGPGARRDLDRRPR